jgi:hypothetical protein
MNSTVRRMTRIGDSVKWEFIKGQDSQGADNVIASYEFGPFPNSASYDYNRHALEEFADQCYGQGMAASNEMHANDTQTLEGYRKQNNEHWLAICDLMNRLARIRIVVTDAWLEGRTIAPDELRDILMGREA